MDNCATAAAVLLTREEEFALVKWPADFLWRLIAELLRYLRLNRGKIAKISQERVSIVDSFQKFRKNAVKNGKSPDNWVSSLV